MPFTNSDKITTNELADEVASRIGIPITRAEWEALIESGDITDQTTTMYYIIDDGAQSTTEEIAEEVLERLGTLDIYQFNSPKNATNGNAKLGLKSIYAEQGTDYTITGAGLTAVTSDSSGNLVVTSTLPSTGVVTGIKGDKESTYRDNNVNITPANIGALPDTTLYAGSSTTGGIATEAAKTSGKITFTGAVTGDFDGSTDKTVNIPKLYGTTGENTDGAITQAAVSSIVSGMVDTLTGTPGVGKTITAFDENAGKITATFADIAINKSQAGLGNVDNKSSATIRSEITSSNVTTALGFTPADSALIGAANGIATLDANGLIPSSLIPGSYDEVIYCDTITDFPATGDASKIYVAKDTNIQYRWGGQSYVAIGSHLALGETSSTAYRGDRGKTAYDHATETKSGAQETGLYKFSVTTNGHIAAVTAIQKNDITALGIPAQDTTYTATDGILLTNGNFTNSGVRSIATGRDEDANGTIAVNTGGTVAAVAVKGLGTAAYTASTAYATAAQGTTADSAVQSVKITGDSTEYKSGTNVVLPAYPTTLPASDVSAWAKAANKPSYTAAEVGAASDSHTHTATIATTTDTNELTLAASTKYKLTAGGDTFVFTTAPDTTYESKAAASGGTDVSLVTTGDKYTWNNKSDLTIGNTGSTAAAGNHTHGTTLATDSGTATVELVANTTYKLSAGGTSVIFKTAPDTTYESKTAAQGGTAVSLVTTGEKYTWNNKSDLQLGNTGSTAAAGNHTHGASIATTSDTNQLTLVASTRYKLTAGGSTFVFTTAPDTTYESKAAASGGTDVSLVTTGDKYTWNNKSDLTIGTTGSTAAAGNHTHTASIAGSSGTSQLDLAADTKYVLTAGGSTFIFKTPPAGSYTSEPEAQGGTTLSLVTTGEKYTWNHKSDLTIGTTGSTAAAGNHTHSYAASSSAGGAATNAKYATSSLTSTSTTQCLRNLASGTAAATTTNCPTGSWYGQHS